MKTKTFLLITAGVLALGMATPALAQSEVEDTTTAIDAAKPDKAESRRDFRENRRERHDKMKDFWDENHDGGARDKMEDRRDHDRDGKNWGKDGMKGPKDNVMGRGKGKGLSDERREEIRKKLESMSPEERKAEIDRMRTEHKQRMEKKFEERNKRFNNRWDNASEEERTQICDRAAERCADVMGSRMCQEVMGKCK